MQLDPATLHTLGEDDLDGRLRAGMFLSAGAPPALEHMLGLGGRVFTAGPGPRPHTLFQHSLFEHSFNTLCVLSAQTFVAVGRRV